MQYQAQTDLVFKIFYMLLLHVHVKGNKFKLTYGMIYSALPVYRLGTEGVPLGLHCTEFLVNFWSVWFGALVLHGAAHSVHTIIDRLLSSKTSLEFLFNRTM